MRDMVAIAKTDIDGKLTILKNFEPLIKKCFKMYVKDFNYFDDVMQEGYITILKCIDLYDLNSKTEFPGYVKMAVINNIRHFSRELKNEISLDDEINEVGGTLLDILESDVNIEGDKIHYDEIMSMHRCLKKLTQKQREIIEGYYFKGLSLQDICANRRCHYNAIVRLKKRALETLRKEMQLYDGEVY